ncbi:hypothetical protein CHS0354_027332 [Potamilus streckersoni]|uniref:Uncharacterized protein n=1 Tax=Potamilus streckersoni TaxID=2493646 RepID=A0AAE0SAV4_9BIVA|nr:hypothetical protein CHS0354_027332 [Potamilus streckersoni]
MTICLSPNSQGKGDAEASSPSTFNRCKSSLALSAPLETSRVETPLWAMILSYLCLGLGFGITILLDVFMAFGFIPPKPTSAHPDTPTRLQKLKHFEVHKSPIAYVFAIKISNWMISTAPSMDGQIDGEDLAGEIIWTLRSPLRRI